MKYKILNTCRSLGILRIMDLAKYWINYLLLYRSNQKFKKFNPKFAVPPYHLAFDAYNDINWIRYFENGKLHAEVFTDIIKKNYAQKEIKILEWGCGPGRIIRHLSRLLPEHKVAVYGSDYNPETIDWCGKNLKDIQFSLNRLMPPLEYNDAEFDVVYNFSVLTHLSHDAQTAWIQELMRVLKPGGLLICTTHGDAYTHLLTSQEEMQRYADGEVVLQGGYAEGKKWYLSIHPEKYVTGTLLKAFIDVRRFAVDGKNNLHQDVWLATKPLEPSLAIGA